MVQGGFGTFAITMTSTGYWIILQKKNTAVTHQMGLVNLKRMHAAYCPGGFSDMEALTSKDIESLSGYIYLRQTEHIAEALQEVSQRNNISRTVTTGLGMDIIGNMACELTSIPYVGMNQILTKRGVCSCTSSRYCSFNGGLFKKR